MGVLTLINDRMVFCRFDGGFGNGESLCVSSRYVCSSRNEKGKMNKVFDIPVYPGRWKRASDGETNDLLSQTIKNKM